MEDPIFPHIVLQWNAQTNTITCAHGPWDSQEDATAFVEGLADENFVNSRYTVEPCVPAKATV